MRLDMMVDIEALGKGTCPPVFQISAVAFNIETGAFYSSSFNEVADIAEIKNIEADTLKWWLKTNPLLLSELVSQGSETAISEEQLIKDFVNWIKELSKDKSAVDEIYLWGNGILFDNRIIKAKCEQYGLSYPIFYRNDRDMRTIVELAAMKIHKTSREFIEAHNFTGTMHNAIDDATNQAEIVCNAYKILMGDSEKES